ncbi:MAG: efflux RND transporter periplasmic adaptor subunit [Planctomycetes bacterium]|nr:efflux RND transporter periplasmic adaptor subunit [Planctomycetota bacterium]
MTSPIPLPGRRIGTRVLLPAAIVASASAILAWSSWRAWAPLTVVRATPVVIRTATQSNPTSIMRPGVEPSSAAQGMVVQAPGWVEPSPFPIAAAALTPGVVREVLVLEGDRIERDQVVARLIDDDARLSLRRAKAEVQVKASELALIEDELRRKRQLVAGGSVSEGEVARLGIKATGAKASLEQVSAARDESALNLSRTEVRSPAAGVVMARLASPGMMVGKFGQDAAIVQLFDPQSLQVKTDVPLSDAGRLRVGQIAQVQFDSLPGQTVRGRVLRLVQQADIAKNTLQAKVLLENPPDGLVPDMLARVRIQLDSLQPQGKAAEGDVGASSRTEIAIPESVLAQTIAAANGTRSGSLRVVVDVRDGVGRIESREVVCAAAPANMKAAGDWTTVFSGLRPGDFVVLPDSPATSVGQSVRVAASPTSTDAATTERDPHANH